MLSNVSLIVQNVSKCYQIYNTPQDRLKQAILLGKKKYYQEFWALKDINFEVKKGEAFGIIGRNGSGKSTLLQLICKTLTPTSGSIEVNGRVAALLELGAGFNPEFTGRENIYINGAILGFNRHEMDERLEQILAFADIGEFIDQPVKTYSSGMFVRLAFAVQACVSPDILVIDEALAVGDVFFRQKCYQFLKKLLEKGTSIILVSHSVNEIEQFCQNALLLKKGKAIFLGSASEAVKHYYLAEQSTRTLSSESQASINTSSKNPSAENFFWPAESCFMDISQKTQVTNGWATCTGIALCDSDGQACYAFQQGDTASFFFEFKLFQDIEVPLTGVVLQNDKSIIVHGKGTTEYGTIVPKMLKSGDILRIRQDICLELAIGEYTFEIGLGAMSLQDYEQRMSLGLEELYNSMIRLCMLPNVGVFSVLSRTLANPVRLLHHGIANLPGHCQMIKL